MIIREAQKYLIHKEFRNIMQNLFFGMPTYLKVPFVRNAMAYYFIDRCAAALGKLILSAQLETILVHQEKAPYLCT